MTISEVPTTRPPPVKYNVQWGYNINHSSIMNASDVLAMYRNKLRMTVKINKRLARELAASQSKVSKLEEANKQHKIEKLALARLKVWLEAGMQCIHDAHNNYSLAIELLHSFTTPDPDCTLIAATVSDEPSTREDRSPPLHPQRRPRAEECGILPVILEENESAVKSRYASPELVAPVPGVVQSSTPIPLMSAEDNGEDEISCSSASPLGPLASSTEAVEPKLNAAEHVAVNHDTAFETASTRVAPAATVKIGRETNSHNPPSTFSPGCDEGGDIYVAEDSLSSRKPSRVPLRPRKSIGNASGIQGLRSRRRSSLLADGHGWLSSPLDTPQELFPSETTLSVSRERDASSDVPLVPSASALDEVFVEASSSSAMQPATAIPENTTTSHARDHHTLEAKASSKTLSKKSRASASSAGLGRSPRLSHDASKGKERVVASIPVNLENSPAYAGSTKTQPEVEKVNAPPVELQTAKTSGYRSRPHTEPACVPPATDDDTVPRYASGRPARRSSLGKNYKEPSLNARYT